MVELYGPKKPRFVFMAVTALQIVLRLRTNIHPLCRARSYSNGLHILGHGPLSHLYPPLDIFRCTRGVLQKGRRTLSTHTLPPPPKSPRARVVSAREIYAQRNRSLFMYTSAVIIFAVGASYAAVPLYRMFCAATGFAGTPVVGTGRFEAERLVPVETAKRIKVHFNADRSEQLPWSFTPQQKYVTVLPGETSLAFYKAKNNSDHDVIGIATYNVTPDRIAPYFAKVECFCFEEQKLLAGEEVDMPLLFFIDKDVLEDPACRNLDDIVLSYTFFKARRNAQGQLEPDAPEDVVQASQGWSDVKFISK